MAPGKTRAAALVVDDHPATRCGLAHWLGMMPEIREVTEADSVAAAVRTAVRAQPDVVLIDLGLPDGSGLEACTRVTAAARGTAVLVLADADMDVHLAGAHRAGAAGFLPKTVPFDRLTQVVRAVLDRQPAYTAGQLERIDAWRETVESRLARLSTREREVFAILGGGRTNGEIAAALAIAERTVECHVQQIYAKLGFVSRRDLAEWVQTTQLMASARW